MVMIYTSIECENDCFEGQLVKTWKRKILGVVDQNDHYFRSYMMQKTIVILYELLYACVF